MAFITAETRSSIVELAMGMLNQAPSTAMLETLIAKSVEGASTQDLADYIATTAAFTAEYPATQTAREFATEMFGKLITGGTLDAEINTAVIDLLEGLLTGGTTKAQGFVAVIDFLANPANAAHADLGDIAQSFQNRADAAEYFSITKELGGSTAAELAAAIASVTSDAATLTAANAASDSTASAEAVVAGQTFTLTTGIDEFVGNGNDNTINAPAVNETTGAATTTIGAGDTLDGGAGTDTLNISVTSADNTSLAGLTVKNVEVVNITNSNYLGAGQGDYAAALATKTAAAKAVTDSASVVSEIVTDLTSLELIATAIATASGGVGRTAKEDMVNALTSQTGTAGLEASLAAATAIATSIGAAATAGSTATATQAELAGLKALTSAQFDAVTAGVTGSGIGASGLFSQAQMNAVIGLMTLDLNAVPVADDAPTAGTPTNALSARALAVQKGFLDALAVVTTGTNGQNDVAGISNAVDAIDALTLTGATLEDTLVLLNGMTPASGAKTLQIYTDLATAAAGGGTAVVPPALTVEPTGKLYTLTEYNTALANAKVPLAGTTALTSIADVGARVGVLKASAALANSVVASVGASSYSSADVQAAVAAVTKDAAGSSLFVKSTATTPLPTDNSTALAARVDAVKEIYNASDAIAGGYNDALSTVVTSYTPSKVTYADIKTAAASLTLTDVDDSGGLAAEIAVANTTLIADYVAAKKADATVKAALINANVAFASAEAGVSAASVSASSFAGAEQVWLKGASGDTAISAGATQIIGFSGVTAMDNAVTTAAASPTFAISASKGDLEVKGAKATSMNFIGTGGTVAPTLNTTGTNELLSVTSSTSGTLTLDLTALTDLESATADGTGALALDSSPTSLATVTTGAGADNFAIKTATVVDNENTDDDETVSAAVSTGAGKDTVVVKTTGAGLTAVDTGAGDDLVVHQSHSTGASSISLGDGNDTLRFGALSNITTKTTISGGAGADTFETSEGTWSSADYLLLKTYVSGFETLTITSGSTIDASKLEGYSTLKFTSGAAVVTEVNGEVLYLGKAEKIAADTTIGITAVAETQSTNLTATAAGYEAATSVTKVVPGADIIAVINGATASTVTLNGDDANLTVGVGTLGASAYIGMVTLKGDITTATANMGSTTFVSSGTVVELVSRLTVTASATELENMSSIKVNGAAIVSINAGSIAADDVVLTTIDLSGMSALAKIDAKGDATGVNLSTASITGNAVASEEVKLGAAQETIVASGSTAQAQDSFSGFTLVASKADATVVVAAASDKISGTGSAGSTFVFDEDAVYTSLTEAVLLLGDAVAADGTTAVQNHIFHVDGNTYVYADDATAGYSDGDILIELTGTYDGDLLAQVISA